jgi:hypothetical protein
MSFMPLIATALMFSLSGPLFAQEWSEFASREGPVLPPQGRFPRMPPGIYQG